ncbi:hypothetical protein ABC255_08625 [Neobacillus sp. 3P2-tot-E-2]|uniref:hypothetical protein n=1 Tax=Neobacillus sp. 3P2-tot-E-2 TaxID=3132212 RepID=UPI0039A0FEBF
MDHAIDSVNVFFEISIDYLYDEWITGEYQKLSDCPSYSECSTYRKAINVMQKFYYGDSYEPVSLKDCIEGHIWVTRNIHVDWKRGK